jgi:hypothetical protein
MRPPAARKTPEHREADPFGGLKRAAGRESVSPYKDQPVRRSPVLEWVEATPSTAGEPADVSLINPASTNASRAEKAALRVALDAPLSTTARCIASVIAV